MKNGKERENKHRELWVKKILIYSHTSPGKKRNKSIEYKKIYKKWKEAEINYRRWGEKGHRVHPVSAEEKINYPPKLQKKTETPEIRNSRLVGNEN